MYDLAIIGGGAAGIACAKYAKNANLKTILIDENIENFGGTCLNRGCIPTKFFLNKASKIKDWNILKKEVEKIILDIKKSLIEFFKRSGVDILWGKALFVDANTLKVNDKKIEAKNIIIAVGSLPKKVDISGYKNIIVADQIFSQDNLPDNFAIIGGGYIGVEFASLLRLLDKKVVVIEKEANILPSFDVSFSSRLQRILEKKGIVFYTSKDVKDVNLEDFDMIVVSVGRQPNNANLGLENASVNIDKNGWIESNEFLQTSQKNIYCCGDATGKKMFAYTAEYQAYICIENILGKKISQDYTGIAECAFSIPQIAKVGLQEKDLKDDEKMNYRIIRSNFLRFSSAYVYDDTDAFIQIIVDNNEYIKGATIISKYAAELISLFSIAIKKNMNISDFKKYFFIHPTIYEVVPLLLRET